jgi:hypothetical protein
MAQEAGKETQRIKSIDYVEMAKKIGCHHPHVLASTRGRCEGCRRFPLSGPSYPDHYTRKLYQQDSQGSEDAA